MINIKIIGISILTFFLLSFNGKQQVENHLKIKWITELKGDFSFTDNWNYPEGVFKNRFGQLSCDGLCPPRIDRMKDSIGKIYPDSLYAFYQLIDTTHLYHSIKSDAWTYEWGEANYIKFNKKPDSSIIGYTLGNVGTHSSLNFKIYNDSVKVWIDYHSVCPDNNHIFILKEGIIFIDKDYFKQGVIKAKFDFKFNNHLNPERKIYWKGLIYQNIETL